MDSFDNFMDFVRDIAKKNNEPNWLLKKRVEALEAIKNMKKDPLIDLDKIQKELKAKETSKWEEVPKDIKETFEQLGIPEAERQYLAGLSIQCNYYILKEYKHLKDWAEKQGIILEDMNIAVKKYEGIVKKYFGTLVKPNSINAALNTALWTSGVFLYVPKGVKVKAPIQGFFYISKEGISQFERTMIIVDENAEVDYIEGCTAPVWHKTSLHAGANEVFVKRNAKLKFTTIQNWSKNVINLPTKKFHLEENAYVKQVTGMLGSKITKSFPNFELRGDNSKLYAINVSFASKGQEQNTGVKVFHIGKNTNSYITSKSIISNGGEATYESYVSATHKKMKSFVKCDSLIINNGTAKSYPIAKGKANINHEAKVGKIDQKLLFYLQTRGFTEKEALSLIINGFADEFIKELNMKFTIEFYKLLKMEIEGG